MCLAKNIRFLRKRLGMSQEQLAAKFGYKSFTTIQKWEMGTSEPPAGVVRALADLFGVNIDDLMKVDLEKRPMFSPLTSKENESYYLNDDARELAEFLFNNPDYKVLFDASRNVRREDIQFIKEMMDRFNGGGRNC